MASQTELSRGVPKAVKRRTRTFLKTCKVLSGRLTRWTMAIQDYEISIERCPGKNNLVEDTLNRLPEQER